MKRLLAFLVLAVHVACGGQRLEAPPLAPGSQQPLSLKLGAASAGGLRAPAGAATYVYVTVLGAGEQPVTFEGLGLPPFAHLSQEGLLTLEPSATTVGEFDFTLRARQGTESASLGVHLVVEAAAPTERPNTAPQQLTPQLVDTRGTPLGMGMDWDCMGEPHLQVTTRDFERDDIRLEITATPQSPNPEPALTYWTSPRTPAGYDGTYVDFGRKEATLTGLRPGVSYAIAFRAVDALGATNGWMSLPSITCFPFGINLESNNPRTHFTRVLRLPAGQFQAVPLEVEGVFSEPVLLTAENLPPYATLSGTTLSFDTPSAAGTGTAITLLARSGGLSSKATLLIDIY